MIKLYENVNNIRSSLNYDIDGVVYKVNDINKHEKIGETSRWPKWALAHFFLEKSKTC